MSVYEQVKQALQDIVAPELKSIQGEIKRLATVEAKLAAMER